MQPQVDLRSSLDITEVARATGVAASTLRFYEEKGLIESIGRRGLHRLFKADVLEQLALIGLGRAAGFSLEEIALMFGPDGRPRIDRRALSAKADEIDATLEKLVKMRDGLRHAAACRAPSHMECPTFQRLLRAVMLRTSREARPSRSRSTARRAPASGAGVEGFPTKQRDDARGDAHAADDERHGGDRRERVRAVERAVLRRRAHVVRATRREAVLLRELHDARDAVRRRGSRRRSRTT